MSQARTIKEQIEELKKLQVLDSEIYSLREEKEEIPNRIKTIDLELETKKSGIQEAEKDLKDLQVRLKDREVSLQQREGQVEKLQIQLYQIKTNKEYAAMLTEIEGLKADNSLLEEEIIKLMEQIDEAKGRILEQKELFKKEEINAQRDRDTINARFKYIESRLKELSEQRDKLLPNIDKQILARYERVLNNRGGLAIVPVEDNACGGCHMNLPPQVISEAKLKEKIITCGTCNRILYVDDNVVI